MKIAIVDDLKTERMQVRNIINDYFSKNEKHSKINIELYEFKSGEDFLKSLKTKEIPDTEPLNNKSFITKPNKITNLKTSVLKSEPINIEGYDLVILDIYMEELSGIEVAKKLYKLHKNCNIIFFTSSTDHMLEGYEVSALGYVLKPINEHKHLLYKALDRAIEKLSPDNEGIIINTKYGESFILYKNLLFIDSSLRNLYFHFQKENLLVSGKYTDYADFLLRDKRFLECYRNLIVNMDYVETVSDSNFILTTGENIPISRRKKIEVMEKYTKYFIEKRCNISATLD